MDRSGESISTRVEAQAEAATDAVPVASNALALKAREDGWSAAQMLRRRLEDRCGVCGETYVHRASLPHLNRPEQSSDIFAVTIIASHYCPSCADKT
jgi:hypothetical protein